MGRGDLTGQCRIETTHIAAGLHRYLRARGPAYKVWIPWVCPSSSFKGEVNVKHKVPLLRLIDWATPMDLGGGPWNFHTGGPVLSPCLSIGATDLPTSLMSSQMTSSCDHLSTEPPRPGLPFGCAYHKPVRIPQNLFAPKRQHGGPSSPSALYHPYCLSFPCRGAPPSPSLKRAGTPPAPPPAARA